MSETHKSKKPQAGFGIIGLGKIGANLARQALEKGMKVAGYTLEGAPADLVKMGLSEVRSLKGFKKALQPPRIVWIYIPAGPAVDLLLEDLRAALDPGDVVVDGGNSYWGDTVRRHGRLAKSCIHLLDAGTSGGMEGARNGCCFMVGGERAAVRLAEPIFKALSVPGGYVHAGPPGSGHFVKLVHNGIEFGMLQAIGEGLDLLEHYRDPLDVASVLGAWRNGSVIRSWLIDLMESAYKKEGGLKKIPPYVEDTGEVNWLVEDALRMEVPVPVIAQSVMQLFSSRDAEKKWARAIAMMRHGFGGHPYGPSEPIRRERKTGRVG